jgi:hypothetical protein
MDKEKLRAKERVGNPGTPDLHVKELSFEQALVEVWRQVLVENADAVVLGTERYPVRLTPKRHLRQIDFVFDGN